MCVSDLNMYAQHESCVISETKKHVEPHVCSLATWLCVRLKDVCGCDLCRIAVLKSLVCMPRPCVCVKQNLSNSMEIIVFKVVYDI